MIFYRYEDYHGACGSLYLGHSLEGSGLDLGSISLLLYEVINLVYSETCDQSQKRTKRENS